MQCNWGRALRGYILNYDNIRGALRGYILNYDNIRGALRGFILNYDIVRGGIVEGIYLELRQRNRTGVPGITVPLYNIPILYSSLMHKIREHSLECHMRKV